MPIDLTAAGFLFDMDGTLVDSHAVVERQWGRLAADHGLDIDEILRVSHGVQAIDTIRRFLPDLSPAEQAAVADDLVTREEDDIDGIVEIPGAAAFLDAITAAFAPVALVTSAPRSLALARLAAAGVSRPRVVVTAEDVERGKPNPDAFLLAAERLGLEATSCVAFEDAPAGIAAAVASGAQTVVVGGAESAETPSLDRITDYRGLVVDIADAGGAPVWRITGA
ncbi:HAD family hydrolase [Schumannella luteola]|uniref:Sugar-phosphatase n=1 Tax=Schumannella luteola TaxID=472059 RepID=A0A852Y835_9MICO|nr:sugar-phosphatase [Schumannella luteola]